MKTISNTLTAVLLWSTAVFGFSSCVWEYPEQFCGTSWQSTEVPLGPFEATTLTLDFLCGGQVCIKTEGIPSAIYGSYTIDGDNAILHGVSIKIDGHTITFIDASLSQKQALTGALRPTSGTEDSGTTGSAAAGPGAGSGCTLFLRWRINDSVYPFTTALHPTGQ